MWSPVESGALNVSGDVVDKESRLCNEARVGVDQALVIKLQHGPHLGSAQQAIDALGSITCILIPSK